MRSGLAVPAQFRALNDAITEMARTDEGRTLLRELHARRLAPDVLWSHYRTRTLHLIPIGTVARDLVMAVMSWREETKRDVAQDTYRVRKELVTHLSAMATEATEAGRTRLIVADLPDAMRMLRVRLSGARDFNIQRAYALAFCRDTLGKQSTVYLGVQAIPPRKVRATTRRHPLTPVEVQAIAAAFDVVRAKRVADSTAKRGVRPIEATGSDTIAMALTGMNPREYAGSWKVRADRVHVAGTKRQGRVRDLPKLFPCALWPHEELPVPSVGTKNYGRWFKAAAEAAGIAATPYDLRRTFANWMEAAGITRTRRRLYLGHAAGDVTDLYETHEVTAHLLADGATLRRWITAQLGAQEARTPEK